MVRCKLTIIWLRHNPRKLKRIGKNYKKVAIKFFSLSNKFEKAFYINNTNSIYSRNAHLKRDYIKLALLAVLQGFL